MSLLEYIFAWVSIQISSINITSWLQHRNQILYIGFFSHASILSYIHVNIRVMKNDFMKIWHTLSGKPSFGFHEIFTHIYLIDYFRVEILEKSWGIKILINDKTNYQTLGRGEGKLYHATPVVTWDLSLMNFWETR